MDAGSDSLQLPPSLPLLPVVHQVLLPTAFVRVQVSAKALKSVALLEHFSSKSAKELLVAVVPSLVPSDRDGPDDYKIPRADKLAPVGTAARVLQLSRLVQSGDWVVLLEGLCRISLHGLASRPNQPYDSVNIQQLELHKPRSSSSTSSSASHTSSSNSTYGSTAAAQPNGSSNDSSDIIPADPAATAGGGESAADLGKELKSNTRRLLQLLSGQAGLPAARRLQELLDAVPPWRAADVVAAALARNSQERLGVLLALDHATRIRLALRMVQQALDAVSAAGVSGSSSGIGRSSRGGSATAPGSSSSKNQRRKGALGALPAQSDLRSSSDLRSGSRDSGPRFGDLGDLDDQDDEDDLAILMARLAAAQPPPEVLRAAAAEAKRLRQGGEMQPGAAAARAYLELLADLPWSTHAWQLHQQQQEQQATVRSNAALPPLPATAADGPGAAAGSSAAAAAAPPPLMPLSAAQALLDSQHYGLHKVKTRIIQHLAVSRLRGFGSGAGSSSSSAGVSSSSRGKGLAPVLCLIGPPGVGKTSLAKSIAEVLGVPFGRIALGGVRDEAEIRGHRRTYVGAMPGRLISAVRKARCKDPLLLLDEVDKLGRDHRGDPAAALLEVLDPEQNHSFTDTYLALPFDLSGVTFVCTANRAADIPPALLDRLEVIELAGYTLNEKVHICQNHLLPDVLQEHGLGPQLVHFPRPTVEYIITAHTREAGVRGLRRALAAVCRHVALNVVLEHESSSAAAAPAAVGLDSSSSSNGRDDVLDDLPTADAAGAGSSRRSRQVHHQQQQQQQPLTGSSSSSSDDSAAAAWSEVVRLKQQHKLANTAIRSSSSSSSDCQPLLQYPDELPCAVVPPGTAVSGSAVYCGGGSSSSSHAVHQYGSSPGVSVTTWAKAGQTAVRDQPRSEAPLQRNAAAAAALAAAAAGSSGRSPVAIPGLSSLTAALMHGLEQQQQESLPLPLPPSQQQQQQQRIRAVRQPGAAASSSSIPYDGSDLTHPPYPPDLLQQQQARVVVDITLVEAVLGPPKYQGAADVAAAVNGPGVAAGLVWTAAGGGVQFVECVRVGEGRPGQMGQLTLTGQVGDVLEESARIALSWIRAHAWELGLLPDSTAQQQQQLDTQQQQQRVDTQQQQQQHVRGSDNEISVHPLRLPVPHQPQLPVQQQQQATELKPGFLLGLGPGSFLPQDDSAAAFAADSGTFPVVSGTSSDQIPTSIVQPYQSGYLSLSGTDASPLVTPGPFPVPITPGPSYHTQEFGVTPGPSQSVTPGPRSSSVTSSPALQWDIHVHFPAGAVPKDGPSAGITLAVALVSLLSGRPVRADTAVTGELTLRGLVLPVGGIKEKLIAARAAGLSRALVPARNMRDVHLEASEATHPEDYVTDGNTEEQQQGVPKPRQAGLVVVPVTTLEDVLAAAFDPPYVLKRSSKL